MMILSRACQLDPIFTNNVEKACYQQFTPLVTFLKRLLYLLTGSLVIQPPAIAALVDPLPTPTLVLESSLSDGVKVDFRKELWVLDEVFRDLSPAHGASLGLRGEAFHTEETEHVATGELDWVY